MTNSTLPDSLLNVNSNRKNLTQTKRPDPKYFWFTQAAKSADELHRALNRLERNGFEIISILGDKTVSARIPFADYRRLCIEAQTEKKFSEILLELEPRLGQLIERATAVDASAEDYCQKDHRKQFAQELKALVGHQRAADPDADARLLSEEAFDGAYDLVVGALPKCHSDWCRCRL